MCFVLQTHRWVKRGLSVCPARYGMNYCVPMQFPAYVAIYGNDGTVSIEHGGVEMGQGVNTKVRGVRGSTQR